ncbi:unnamed protein product [Clonostachys solani]|uniref:Uncharacterized protein n=1 Tax=Clonostachys solani TaxID=160281 RepID=A0A9N9ZEN4_9HYPO|nr:unnamed protein product [Clonostachys solani]
MESNSQASETMLPLKRFDNSPHYDQDDDNSSVLSSYEQGSHSSVESKSTASTSLRSSKTPQKQQLKPIVIQKDKDMAATFGYQFKTEDPRGSTETYNSVFSEDSESQEDDDESDHQTILPTDDDIPAVLPQYRASIIDPFVRPSTPDAFGRLFPSMDRLSIRHDDLTPDGNMNLRVDTVVPGRNGRRPLTVQLFHLRMHDLGRREFSLRRYCRDSGREVCNSKRAYAEPGPTTRPGLQRSFSSVMRSVKGLPFRVHHHTSQSPQGKGLAGTSSASSSWDAISLRSMRIRRDSWTSDKPPPSPSCLVPTNTVKLEFSNYARVDISRNNHHKVHHYDFEWWGHKYSWKRVLDKDLSVVSYHLMRDGHGMAVAHITPEMRSPNQIQEEEWAGGWIPPCHMWISDPSIVNAATDVADVIVATGLIALVDDCIKNRWHAKKQPKMARSKSNDLTHTRRRSLVQEILHRRHSEQHRRLVAAY